MMGRAVWVRCGALEMMMRLSEKGYRCRRAGNGSVISFDGLLQRYEVPNCIGAIRLGLPQTICFPSLIALLIWTTMNKVLL